MIAAIIPARGGSKGIPNKNLQRLNGVPLFHLTIGAATGSSYIDKVFLTTDDDEIASYCEPFDAVEVLSRPDELAQDEVQVDEVVLFTYRQISQIYPKLDTIVVLQPTSPFRTSEHIDEAIELYRLFKPFAVFGMESSDGFYYRADEGKAANPIGHDPKNRLGRQYTDFYEDEVLRENGSIYIVDAQRLSDERSFRLEPIVPYRMDRMSSHEIDTPGDWAIAEAMLKNKELFQ